MTELLLSRAHYPVSSLGPGVRAGIWTQGCTLGCAGCLSRDTWPADPATSIPVDTVLSWLASLAGPVDGVTISGGEPFQQPAALRELLCGIAAWRGGRPVDVLVYTGYILGRLQRAQWSRDLLELCDAVVAGPYVDRLNTGLRWRGSANQRILALTELGRQRYSDVDAMEDESTRLQVCIDGTRLYYIGIPRRGDMDRVAEALARAGVDPGEASWRP